MARCVPMGTATKRGKGGRRVLRQGFKWAKRRQGCPIRAKAKRQTTRRKRRR